VNDTAHATPAGEPLDKQLGISELEFHRLFAGSGSCLHAALGNCFQWPFTYVRPHLGPSFITIVELLCFGEMRQLAVTLMNALVPFFGSLELTEHLYRIRKLQWPKF
jgi:hypothetical protein